MTDALCREGIAPAARALPRAVRDGQDLDARSDMSLASLWSGIALANAGLGAVHGFAGPSGGMFDAPHGAVCAALLPPVYAANWSAIQSRTSDHPAAGRCPDAAGLLTGRATASLQDAVDWTRELVNTLGVPGLAAYGVREAHVDELVDK